MCKIVFLYSFCIFITTYAVDNFNVIENIWVGNDIHHFDKLFQKKHRSYYCVEIKAKEKKAYFYIENPFNPIITDLERVEDNKYAFVYKNNRIFFDSGKRPDKINRLSYFTIMNQKKFDRIHLVGMFSFLEFNKLKLKDQNFTNNIEGCLNYLKWEKERLEKLQLENPRVN